MFNNSGIENKIEYEWLKTEKKWRVDIVGFDNITTDSGREARNK